MTSQAPEQSRHLRIFISYARCDENLANALCDRLSRLPKVEILIDRCILLPGDDFAEELATNVVSADITIVLWTPNSAERHWVLWEAHSSFFTASRVIILKIGSDAEIPYPLSRLHRLSSSLEEHEIDRIFAQTVDSVKNLDAGQSLQRSLWQIANAPDTVLEFDDEAFYRNAVPEIGQNAGHSIFISGTPAVILPEEASTTLRVTYMEKLMSVYGSGKSRHTATYITNFERVNRHLSRYEEASVWHDYTSGTAALINSRSFDISSSTLLRWAPSGYLGDNFAVLVLKYPEPSRQEDTMAVLTVRGEKVAQIKRRIRHLVQPSIVSNQIEWWPRLLDIVETSRSAFEHGQAANKRMESNG